VKKITISRNPLFKILACHIRTIIHDLIRSTNRSNHRRHRAYKKSYYQKITRPILESPVARTCDMPKQVSRRERYEEKKRHLIIGMLINII